MSARPVRMRIAPVERLQLRQLVQDLCELIGPGIDPEDPAVARLTPNPYPDDSDAARDFRSGTRGDLLARRAADAGIVSAAVAGVADEPDSWAEETALVEEVLEIPAAEVDAWMRTLTAIRLVIATRLGIVDEEDHDPDDARFGVYDWLGYRLEMLIQAAEDQAG